MEKVFIVLRSVSTGEASFESIMAVCASRADAVDLADSFTLTSMTTEKDYDVEFFVEDHAVLQEKQK